MNPGGSGIDTMDGRVLAQIDACGAGGAGQGFGQIPGVEALFFEEEELPAARIGAGGEVAKLGFRERLGAGREMADALDGAGGADGNHRAGEGFDTSEEGRIELQTEAGKLAQLRGILRIGAGKHPGRGAGGFSHGFALIEDGDFASGSGELQGGGETDETGAGDCHFCPIHRSIVGPADAERRGGWPKGCILEWVGW